MADLIDRQAAIKLLRGECVAKYPCSFIFGLAAAADELSKLPTIDPESLRPKGKWIEAEDGDGVICSVCREDFCTIIHETDRFNFCPNCGADLRGEGE